MKKATLLLAGFLVVWLAYYLGTKSAFPDVPNVNAANVNKSIECKNVNKCEVCENKTEYYPVEKVVEVKKTLKPEQRKSLESLVLKPYENWSEQDKKNWAYATDGLPVPFKTVTKVETKWIEKVCAGNTNTNVNTNSNTNSSVSVHLDLKDRINLKERLEDRGITVKDGKMVINLNRSR